MPRVTIPHICSCFQSPEPVGDTSNKSYESVLNRLRDTRLSSGKRTLRIVEGFEDSVAEEYKHVLDLAKTQEDDRNVEQIIEDDYPDSLT